MLTRSRSYFPIGSMIAIPKVEEVVSIPKEVGSEYPKIPSSRKEEFDQIVNNLFAKKCCDRINCNACARFRVDVVTCEMVLSEYARKHARSEVPDEHIINKIQAGLSIMEYLKSDVRCALLYPQQKLNRKCMQARAIYDIFLQIKQSWSWVLAHPKFRLEVGPKAACLLNDLDYLYNPPCMDAESIKPTRQQVTEVLKFAIEPLYIHLQLVNPPVRRSSRIAKSISKANAN